MIKNVTKIIIVFILFSLKVNAATLVHFKVEAENSQLVLDILKLAMSKSSPNTHFVENKETTNIFRFIEKMDAGKASLMWSGTTTELQNKLRAIKIPILKGLLGHRLLLIRNGEQNRFDHIKDIEDLKEMTAGQGAFWGDALILKENLLPVITTKKWRNLFLMLNGKRFDYFPRALHEPWVEIEEHKKLNFSIEKNLLLVYPYAMYFFVSKKNEVLAQQIEKGLNEAINDGSYDKLFFNHPMVKNALAQAHLQERTVINLTNSVIPRDMPIKNKKYWLDLKILKAKKVSVE